MRLGYRWQILLAFALPLVLGWIGASSFLHYSLATEVDSAFERHARTLAQNLAMWGEESVLTERRMDLLRLVDRTRDANPDVAYVYVRGPAGSVVASTFGAVAPKELVRVTSERDRTIIETERGKVIDYRSKILDGLGGDVHVGYLAAHRRQGLDRFQNVLWTIAVVVLVLGLVALWVVGALTARPTLQLTDAVRRFGAGDTAARAKPHGARELQLLAETFNEMADKLTRQSQDLRYLTTYNQQLIDNLGCELYVIGEDLHLQFANRQVDVHRERLNSGPCYAVLHGRSEPCTDCVALEARRTRASRTGTRKLASGVWLEDTAIPLSVDDRGSSVIVVSRDVSEAVRLREDSARAGKLAAIGELSAAVAHEINNPLDGIRSILHLVAREEGQSPTTVEHLGMVQAGITRIEMCVRRLLSFGASYGQGTVASTPRLQLEHGLALVGPALENAHIAVDLQVADGLGEIHVESDRFTQMIVNLVLLAAEDVPAGGTLAVAARQNGGCLSLMIANCTPPEMSCSNDAPEMPFGSWATSGRESFLGLVVSRRIAEEHGGRVEVRDAPGGGVGYEVVFGPVARLFSGAPAEVRS